MLEQYPSLKFFETTLHNKCHRSTKLIVVHGLKIVFKSTQSGVGIENATEHQFILI